MLNLSGDDDNGGDGDDDGVHEAASYGVLTPLILTKWCILNPHNNTIIVLRRELRLIPRCW